MYVCSYICVVGGVVTECFILESLPRSASSNLARPRLTPRLTLPVAPVLDADKEVEASIQDMLNKKVHKSVIWFCISVSILLISLYYVM